MCCITSLLLVVAAVGGSSRIHLNATPVSVFFMRLRHYLDGSFAIRSATCPQKLSYSDILCQPARAGPT